jgi:hypothetical protein
LAAALGGIFPAPATAQEIQDLSTKVVDSSFLSSPTSGVLSISGGGYYQTFLGGNVYQAPKAPAFAVEGGRRSPILSRYLSLGGPTGKLGFPTEPAPSPGTSIYPRMQRFDNGSIIAINELETQVWGLTPPSNIYIYSWATTTSAPIVSTVSLSWWNRGAQQTLVNRRVNGGAWTTIRTYGALETSTNTTFTDTQATPDAENCYVVAASDGLFTKSSPERCVYTRDGRGIKISRAQLRIHTSDAYANGWPETERNVEVRLQSPGWLEKWRPAGNSTWIDSTASDFWPGSTRTYDLMLNNIADASDITMITVNVPTPNGLCIAEMELLLDYSDRVPYNTRAFYQNYGNTSCRWAKSGSPLSIPFTTLRASTDWQNLRPHTFPGFTRDEFKSLLEAKFADALHDEGGRLNSAITQRIHDDTLWAKVWLSGSDFADFDCDVTFKLVIHRSEANDGSYRMMIEDPRSGCTLDWVPLLDTIVNSVFTLIPVWHYSVDADVERAMVNMGGARLGIPPPGYHFCFPAATSEPLFPNREDGGFTVCSGSAP